MNYGGKGETMRLIDADALLDAISVHLERFEQEIDDAPTIDPFKGKSLEQLMDDAFTRGYYRGREVFNPVKHGKWLKTDAWPHHVFCSECYKTFAEDHWKIWIDGSLPRSYCPNCGARVTPKNSETTPKVVSE